jgi:O-antigen/teichoic acid export membrane protein
VSRVRVGGEARKILRRVATGAAWSVLGAGAARLLALVAAVLVARVLGAAPFGELNLVQGTAGMLMALGGFGLNAAATKFLAGRYRGDPAAAGRVVVLSGALSAAVGAATGLLLLATAPFVARTLLGAPHLAGALRLGAALLVLGPVNGTQLGILTGLERFPLIAAVSTTSAAASVPLLVLGARLGGMRGGVAAVVASAAVTALLYGAAVRRALREAGIRPVWRDALQEWRPLFAYSLPTTVSNLLLAPVTWATQAIVAHQAAGLRELGLFAAANQWRNAIVLVATAAGAVVFPLFSHLHDGGYGRSFARAFWASLALTALASLAAAGALGAASPHLMGAYGAEFAGATRVLLVLLLAGAVAAPLTIVNHALAGAGRTWVVLGLNLLWASAIVSLTWALRARGAQGLALAHLGAYALHLAAGTACAASVVRGRAQVSPSAAPRAAVSDAPTA